MISSLAFAFVHVGKPPLEMAGAVISGFALCWLALRSKSIWPDVLLHWQVAMTMDFLASDWWR